MKEQDRNHKQFDLFLIFSAVLIFGSLLAISALAQSDQGVGLEVPPSQDAGVAEASNQKPNLTSFGSDRPGPQEAGTSIGWTATATDPDGDSVLYLFQLRGPSTGGEWQKMTGWQQDGNWRWDTSAADVGNSDVSVWIRDGNHAGSESYDDQGTQPYRIDPAASQAAAQNEVAPAIQPDGTQQQPEQPPAAPPQSAPPNQPPVMKSLTSTPSESVEAGGSVVWTAEAEDTESDPLRFQFSVDGNPKTDWQDSPTWTWTTSIDDVGSHTVEASVKDDKHAGPEGIDGNRSAEFTITAPAPEVPPEVIPAKINESPSLTDLKPDMESPQIAGSVITWTATASDPEGDPINYRFLLNGSVAADWQSENQWTWTAAEIGTSQILVQVKDDKHADPDGIDGNRSAEFTITAPAPEVKPEAVPEVLPARLNESPSLTDLKADMESPQIAGSVITWTAKASDPEGDPISYRFLFNGSVAADWQPENQWTWTAAEIGTSQISVQVKDDKHAGPEGIDGNRSAEFTITTPEPEVKPEAPPEVIPARLNESPSLTDLKADMESPQIAGSVITWTAKASDPEGDPISYRFLLNGSVAADWQPENQWTWTAAEIGTSQISVQVKDDKHAGPEGIDGNRSAEFTITAPAPEVKPETPPEVLPARLNESPSLTDLKADMESPQVAGSVIIWTATASDPESDPINYRFFLNGTPISDWQSENQWTWTAAEIGTSKILVQAKDDKHADPEGIDGNKSAEFTITSPAPQVQPAEQNATPAAENQTPVLNALMPDRPSPQGPDTTVTWTANATDSDSDKIFFRFFHSGPATGMSWQPVTEWTATSTWTWSTTEADAGDNQIRVWIRDGKHAAEDGFDAEQVAPFTVARPARNISGAAFNDKNGNGQKDGGEPGLSGWTIRLVKPDGSDVATITDDQGMYRFGQLLPGSYTVAETTPSSWKATAPESGSYTLELKDADISGQDFGNKLESFSISGVKFNDLNANGKNDEGEPGLSGWTVQLAKDGSAVNSTTTGQDGSYRFENLPPGGYTVSEAAQPGWTRTVPKEESYSVELKDADVTGKDFGNHGSWSVSGTKFHDQNGDGVRDSGEPGLSGWTIQLARDGGAVNATTTGQDGTYAFRNLPPGSYTVSEISQNGWAQTVPQGSYSIDLKDADATGKDFGNRGNQSLSGVKYYDINNNGVQDPDEPGIPGGEVSLMDGSKVIASATTDENGVYTFTSVLPGTYTISDPAPEGLVLTTPATITVTVTGLVVIKTSFGLTGSYAISGVKYNDQNGNAAKDPGEPAIPGWGIVLTGSTWFGKPLPPRTAITGPDGSYKFDKLLPGTYTVNEVSRTGWTQKAPAGGSYSITFPFKSTPKEAKNNDFGNTVVAQSISGVKYNDLNGNGARDPGEPGLVGWIINLEQPAGTIIKTETTASDGSYIYTGLAAGTYLVREVPQPEWTQKAPAGGTYTVTLDATTTSAIGKDFGNYNPLPANPTLTPDIGSPQRAGTPVGWTAGATDTDPLQYRFFVRGPSPSMALRADSGYSANNVWTWSTAGYAAGAYQVEVWIRDGRHAGPGGFDVKKTVAFSLTSANLPPEVGVLFADQPVPQFAGSWVRWTALASDPEGDPIQYRFFLRGPSTGGLWIDQTGWGRNNRWIWRTSPLDAGQSEVLVAVRDGKHAGPAGSDDYEIDGYDIIDLNLPPVITSLGTSAKSPQSIGATVRWSATAANPEGNPLFFRYWLKGPATGGLWRLVRDWSTDPTWTWATSSRDAGTSEITVQVKDGLHAGTAGWDDDAGALFTMLRPNQPPKATALAPDRKSPQAVGTPVKWTASAVDADGDQILYQFWLRGPSTGGAWRAMQDWSNSNQWTWASAPADAGSYSVYVYIRDGKHAGPQGFDSALGADYALENPMAARKVTAPSARGAMPSLLFIGDGYLMAHQSWEKGAANQGDVVLQKFDPSWNQQKMVWVADSKAPESAPSLAAAGGYFYVAYVSAGKGGRDIFVKKYDKDLKLIDTKQLTSSPTSQDSPSLLAVGSDFLLAYQSFDSGSQKGGDIYLTRFDPNWKPQSTVQLTRLPSRQDRPALAIAGGSIFVAYVSSETGRPAIFMKRLNAKLEVLDTKKMTPDKSDQDYPSLKWQNGQLLLLYASKKAGNYEIMLDRYLRDGKPIDSTLAVSGPGDQTGSSLAFSTLDGMYWVAYASRDASGQNVYVKPLKLAAPAGLRPCDIAASFSATKAGSPYTLTLKFTSNYGELTDPVDLSFNPPKDSARPTDKLQKVSQGTLQFKSVFGAKGEKSFKIGANIDGCISAKAVVVKVN